MAALDDYDWTGAADEIEALMRRYYPDLLATGYSEGAADIPGVSISFDLANPRVKDVIDGLATRIRGVTDTTRDDVRRLVDLQTEQGWSLGQLAEQIRGMGEINSKSRAMLISRTESATAYNKGAVLAYSDAGVTHVTVLDGDYDAECAAANGQTWTLDQADSNPIAHPNCVRAFAPYLGDVKPQAPVAPEPPASNDPYAQRFSGDNFRDFTNTGQMELFGKKYYTDWADSLSREEIDGLRGYQERAYGPINDILRGIGGSNYSPEQRAFYQSYIDGIDSAIGRTSIPYNVNAYRGFNAGVDLAPGTVFTDSGYASTSLNPSTAAKFAIDNNGVVARIRVPRGTKGAYLDALNSKEEYEVLMGRGTTFKVVSVSEEEMLGRTVKVVDLEPTEAGKSKGGGLDKKASKKPEGRAARFLWDAGDIVIVEKPKA